MYLHELKLWNFRKYGINGDIFESSEPGLKIQFRDGVNVLVGENDSGKTTIVDAIRYVLRTQSLEYIQVEEKDFHQDCTNNRTSEMKIECTFKGFSDAEAGHFLEWIGFEEKENGSKEYILKIWLYARMKDNSIYQSVRAGVDIEGSYIEGEARDLLRVVYLKPLRDALSEMTHGSKSRLAQILKSHSIFKRTKDEQGKEIKHILEDKYNTLKDSIDGYFNVSNTESGKEITETINRLLGEKFLLGKDARKAGITLTGSDLVDILKQLDLVLEKNKSGLGSLNLLFIAAELLLFEDAKSGLKLTLIEELEAHLHPQYQLRLIDFINTHKQYGQFILTTHSTTLASKIDLSSLIICSENHVFPMGAGHTNLNPTDYRFLERFLDATKANLFFAKGVIIVEGDAENLLIPTIAEIIERPLHKYGVSIVNVGGTAFKRYANIFVRKEEPIFNINVSIISDLDVRSLEGYNTGETPSITPVEQGFIDKLSAITKDVNYHNLPEFFKDKTEFEDFLKNNKAIILFPNQPTGQPSIKEQLLQVFESETQKPLNETLLTSLRKNKKERIENQWSDKLPVKIFLPEQWTLEYEIASGRLYKYLHQAIELAKIEKSNPYFSVSDADFNSIKDDTDNQYDADILTDKEKIYAIFQPICNGAVSKAIVAQYLAQILIREKDAGVNVKDMISSDPQLKYIVDAIYYVTEPITTTLE